jgi:hypothetical protein
MERSVAANAALAAVRIGTRRARRTSRYWLAVPVALTLAGALLGETVCGAVVAGDRAARQTLSSAASSVSLSWNGGATAEVDRQARRELAAAGAVDVGRGLVMLPTTFARHLIRPAAVRPVAPGVHVMSGRLPRGQCRATRCEVLRVSGPALPRTLVDRHVRLIVTGTATVDDPHLRGAQENDRQTVLLAGDPAGLDRLEGLSSVSRTQSWSGHLRLARLHAWHLSDRLRRLAVVRQHVEAVADGFSFSGPEQALQAALASSQQPPGRMRAAAATGLAALLAFLVTGALPMRSGALAEQRRLMRSGASAAQRAAAAAVETAIPVAAGIVLAAGAAGAVGLLRAGAAGVPSGAVLSAADGELGRALGILAAVAWLIVLATAILAPRVVRAAAGAVLIAAAASLSGVLAAPAGGATALPKAVVPLTAITLALVVGLSLPLALRALARSVVGHRLTTGLTLTELAREPGMACVVAGGMAAAMGVAGFAVSVDRTVRANQRAQASQRVPFDAVVSPGSTLAPPLRRLTAKQWSSTSGPSVVAPVLREHAAAFAGPTRTDATVLGIPASDLSGVRLAARLRSGGWNSPLDGAPLPAGTRRLTVRARSLGDNVDLAAYVRDPDGYGVSRLQLGTVTQRSHELTAAVPARARGGTLDALVIDRPLGQKVSATHQLAEGGGGSSASTGTLAVASVRADGQAVGLAAWRGHGAVGGAVGHLRFSLDGSEPAVARPPRPRDRAALPVLATRQLAADARVSGGLTVQLGGLTLPAKVVGSVAGLPTVGPGSPALVADARALISALDSVEPGTAQVRELWVKTPDVAAVSDAARRRGLSVVTHEQVLNRLRGQPLATELLRVTSWTALACAVLAALALGLFVRAQLSGDSHALVDLEAQGFGPRMLRRTLLARAVVLAVLGAAAGAVGAFGLDFVVGRAALSAFERAPDPPIAPVVPTSLIVGAAAAAAILAVLTASLALFGAFRAPVPRPAPAAEVA